LLPEAVPPQASHLRTPVWLVERAERAAHLNLLLHLGDAPAEGFESFGRMVEIVSGDPHEREAARARWKHYKARGYEIQKHEVAA
jgi:DNA polymerase III subunit chi